MYCSLSRFSLSFLLPLFLLFSLCLFLPVSLFPSLSLSVSLALALALSLSLSLSLPPSRSSPSPPPPPARARARAPASGASLGLVWEPKRHSKHAFCLRKTFRKRCKHVFLSLGSLLEPRKREHHEHQRPPPGHPKPPETRRLYVLERLRAHQTPKSKTPNALKRIRGPAVRVFCRHEAVRARKMSDFRGVFTWTHKTLGIYEVFCCWNTPPSRAS